MGIISYEDAVQAQKEIEDSLLKDPNVVSIGVIKETAACGKKTGNYVIEVGVMSLPGEKVYSTFAEHGRSTIPDEYVLPATNQSKEKKHVRILVVEEGQVCALNLKDRLPSAIDNLPLEDSGAEKEYRNRLRPSQCGYSVGHPKITAGTIGLVLSYSQGPNVNMAYILSNNHYPMTLAKRNYSTGYAGIKPKQTQPRPLTIIFRQRVREQDWVGTNIMKIISRKCFRF